MVGPPGRSVLGTMYDDNELRRCQSMLMGFHFICTACLTTLPSYSMLSIMHVDMCLNVICLLLSSSYYQRVKRQDHRSDLINIRDHVVTPWRLYDHPCTRGAGLTKSGMPRTASARFAVSGHTIPAPAYLPP